MWILILVLTNGFNNGGRALDHIEFNNNERCIVAANLALKNTYSELTAICVPK